MRAVSTAFPATTLLRFLPSSPCPFDPRTWRKMLMGFGSARFSLLSPVLHRDEKVRHSENQRQGKYVGERYREVVVHDENAENDKRYPIDCPN